MEQTPYPHVDFVVVRDVLRADDGSQRRLGVRRRGESHQISVPDLGQVHLLGEQLRLAKLPHLYELHALRGREVLHTALLAIIGGSRTNVVVLETIGNLRVLLNLVRQPIHRLVGVLRVTQTAQPYGRILG